MWQLVEIEIGREAAAAEGKVTEQMKSLSFAILYLRLYYV